MSIFINTINENNQVHPVYKTQYGEIHTPFYFINEMLDCFSDEIFKNSETKWLDIGAGRGNFSIVLYQKLYNSLVEVIPDNEKRKKHIIKKMIFMIEVNPENIRILKFTFGKYANIIYNDFLTCNLPFQPNIIIGNPPFNINGQIKVPTNQLSCKKQDGKNAWCPFIQKCLHILPKDGLLNVIIPSIWMKPDKAKMYDLLLSYKITKLKTYNCSETKKIFYGEAQTPTCSFLLKKCENIENKIELFDKFLQKYVSFSLYSQCPIPLQYGSIIEKIYNISKNYPKLQIEKTNMPSKNTSFQENPDETFKYENISTYIQKEPYLIKKYSNKPCAYYNKPKIIFAHKMYGLPFLDKEGKYGICNRDNYIITNKSDQELEIMLYYMNHPIIYFLYETTRYRMRYLEKYAFEFIFDFSVHFKDNSTCLYNFFNLNQFEKKFIETFKKC
tara:strand:- start:16253 stop:17581 length:1329 start_codon:yes stop_codon:yes gene_type:complete